MAIQVVRVSAGGLCGGIQVAGLGNGRRLVLTSLTELATGVGGLYCSADTASGLDVLLC